MIDSLATDSSVKIAGHRGFKAVYPENTLLSFEKALETGVDMLEFDLRLTRDGVIVVIHDATVDRTTDGSGEVSGFTLEELKKLDAGIRFGERFMGLAIPTLEELCELLARHPGVLLNVEVKPAPQAEQVADRAVALLERKGLLPRCVFTCFDATVVAYLHRTYGLKMQGFPEEEMFNFVPGPGGTYSQLWAVGIPMRSLTPETAAQFRGMGLLVWCYCPNTSEQVRHALNCGVTLMTCDDPLPALQAVRRANPAEA